MPPPSNSKPFHPNCCIHLLLTWLLACNVLQKFRPQGGEGFEAPQDEEYDLEALEAAQQGSGQHREQRVSDSLKEAGFVKPLQHENPDADQEETARIGGRLVESGFGRLQYEDAMEHAAQRRQRSEFENPDDMGETADIIDGVEPDHLTRADHVSGSNAQHATRGHVTDPAEHAEDLSHASTQDPTEPAELHMTEFENQVFPAGAHVTEPEEAINPIQAGRTHMAELGQNPTLTELQADETVQLVHPGRTHVAEPEADRVSELCPELATEPTPRKSLHLQNEAAQLAAEVAEFDHAQVKHVVQKVFFVP